MKGHVDDHNRALLDINICRSVDEHGFMVTAWIDTAFDGHLVLSTSLMKELELETLVETEAVLADGSKVLVETFLRFVGWFGNRIPAQVIANDGNYPLLGTGLHTTRRLTIDYQGQVLSLD